MLAQSNTVAAGGEATGSGGMASISAGEVFYTYKSGSDASVTEGMQQSYVQCTDPTMAGSISGDQFLCEDMIPQAIDNVTLPSGEIGELQYKWQSSPAGGGSGFTDIPGSNATTYQPPAVYHTTWYRRLARVDCSDDWGNAAISNEVKMTVVPLLPGYLSVQTLQQPKCIPPQGCKLSISGIPTATWVMQQTGPVKATIEGSTDPVLIENLPDGVYRFRVAGPAGCLMSPPFGAIIITH